MASVLRLSPIWFGLLTGCGADGGGPSAPADPTVPETPAAATAEAPPTSEVPTVASTLAELPKSPLHGTEQRVIAEIASLCATDCAPVLAAAKDGSLPDQHREALWWGILTSPDSGGRADLQDEARRALDHPSTPDGARMAAAYLILAAPDGRAYLDGVFRSGQRAGTRAAAGCALIQSLPINRWREYQADAATVDAMGICATPWHYGQREGPPG